MMQASSESTDYEQDKRLKEIAKEKKDGKDPNKLVQHDRAN